MIELIRGKILEEERLKLMQENLAFRDMVERFERYKIQDMRDMVERYEDEEKIFTPPFNARNVFHTSF